MSKSHPPHQEGSLTAPSVQRSKIVNYLFNLKSRGLRDSTIEGVSKTLKNVARFADLDDPNSVRVFVGEKMEEGKITGGSYVSNRGTRTPLQVEISPAKLHFPSFMIASY